MSYSTKPQSPYGGEKRRASVASATYRCVTRFLQEGASRTASAEQSLSLGRKLGANVAFPCSHSGLRGRCRSVQESPVQESPRRVQASSGSLVTQICRAVRGRGATAIQSDGRGAEALAHTAGHHFLDGAAKNSEGPLQLRRGRTHFRNRSLLNSPSSSGGAAMELVGCDYGEDLRGRHHVGEQCRHVA